MLIFIAMLLHALLSCSIIRRLCLEAWFFGMIWNYFVLFEDLKGTGWNSNKNDSNNTKLNLEATKSFV